MTWRLNLLLAGLGLAIALLVARFQQFPGYLDSDYYFAGGMQLAQGRGFSEPYIWNYLDDPAGLPHPSHAYWMPLASLVAAAGMWFTGSTTYISGRLGFIVLAAVAPVVVAALAYSFSRRRELALVSGLLAVFSIYYMPFLPVPDNYAVYVVLGTLFFLTMGIRGTAASVIIGLLAGLMSLARSDGVLWLALAAIIAVFDLWARGGSDGAEAPHDTNPVPARLKMLHSAVMLASTVIGFLLVMGPWYARNFATYGSLMAPGGQRLLWLTAYDETFAYPAAQLTYTRWIAQGWSAILSVRLGALRWNLLNAFAAQGGIFLAPFIVLGAWMHRRDPRVKIGLVAWLTLVIVMTLIFPFAGSRGGFFHAGAAVQGLWWALAPLGLEAAVNAARRRGMFTASAFTVFRGALVGIAMLMSAVIFVIRVAPGWGEGEQVYPKVEEFLKLSGAGPDAIVMVRNPPGYYMMTGRSAIVIPFADEAGILAAAERYRATYVVIEQAGAAGPIKQMYESQGGGPVLFLGEVDGTRIFKIQS